jgi:transcriptional antiterminator RfaH
MKQWFALYTNPRAEKSVFSQLHMKEIEVFLPVQKVLKQYKRRKKKVEEVLFKSYIFVRISSARYFEVINTKGVVRFISFEGKPVPVPDNQIEIVKRLIKNEMVFDVEDSVFSKGDCVEVTDGILKGLKGILVNFKGSFKVAVALDTLNKSLILEIDRRLLRNL